MNLTIVLPPTVTELTTVNQSTLEYTADYHHAGIAKVRITKTPNGFAYEDIGFYTSHFDSINRIIREFALPYSVKSALKSLKTDWAFNKPADFSKVTAKDIASQFKVVVVE